MNQQFNMTRFILVLKAYWAENVRSYLLALSLIVGSMLLIMLSIIGTSQFNGLLYTFHVLALFGGTALGGFYFTNTAFANYATSERGVAAIMVPASQLEKYLPILLFSFLGTVSVFVIGFWLHGELVTLANQGIADTRKYEPAPSDVKQFYAYTFFVLQGTLFLGSLYFTKNSLIKTLGSVLIVTILAFVLNLFLTYHFTGYPQSVMAFPFTFWNIFESEQRYTVRYPEPIDDLVEFVPMLIVVALVCITYVRLKEKEI
jgi:hypothetical protein